MLAMLLFHQVGAQSPSRRSLDMVDSLGLDPVLLQETGYFTNTYDGYTAIQGLDKRWYYATINQFDNVVSTDVPLGAAGKSDGGQEQAFRKTADRHLERNPRIKERLRQDLEEWTAAIETAAENATLNGSATGAQRLLVLAVEFPDYPADVTILHVDSMMNVNSFDPNSGRGSFRDYFVRNSYGKFIPDCRVYGWFEAEHPVRYYTDTLDGKSASSLLVDEALRQADLAGVDFSEFDNNGDGVVTTVTVVTPLRIATPHHSYIRGKQELQSVRFESFAIQELNLGLIVHEYGHALGLKDLYMRPHTFGYYDPMAQGFYGNPGNLSAYSKILLGWIDPLVIDQPVNGLEVPSSRDHPFAVLIRGRNGTDWSYFVIENRIAEGYDAGPWIMVATSGLLIYHIHEQSTDWSHVEQADGRWDLEAYAVSEGREGNRGDAGDVFPGATGNTRFGRDTDPSSRTEGGVDTGILISNISAPGKVMTFDVTFPVPIETASSEETVPGGFALLPNYPNPFSGSTAIPYRLPAPGDVTVKIFDAAGREIATIASGMKPAGLHTVRFDGSSLPPGVYFCRLTAGTFVATEQVVMVR